MIRKIKIIIHIHNLSGKKISKSIIFNSTHHEIIRLTPQLLPSKESKPNGKTLERTTLIWTQLHKLFITLLLTCWNLNLLKKYYKLLVVRVSFYQWQWILKTLMLNITPLISHKKCSNYLNIDFNIISKNIKVNSRFKNGWTKWNLKWNWWMESKSLLLNFLKKKIKIWGNLTE